MVEVVAPQPSEDCLHFANVTGRLLQPVSDLVLAESTALYSYAQVSKKNELLFVYTNAVPLNCSVGNDFGHNHIAHGDLRESSQQATTLQICDPILWF